MRTLDRHISGLFLKVWAVCVIGAPMFSIIIKLTDDLDKYLARGLTPGDVMLAYLYDFPYQMSLSFPVAALFGAVFAVALMSRHSEVTAAKASGISFYRLIAPLVLLGTVLSLAALALGEIVPVTNRLRAETLQERGRSGRTVRSQFVYGSDGGRAYAIRRLDAEEGEITEVIIDREGTGAEYPTYRVYALRGEWVGDTWRMEDGYMHYYPEPGRTVTFAFNELVQRDFSETPQQLLAQPKDPEEMNYVELGRFIESIQRSGGDVRQLVTERMLKIAFPAACFIVILFGSALGMSTGSAGPAFGVGIALAAVLVYLLMIRISEGMGAGGLLPPELAAWLPNLIFLSLGLVLLVRTRT